MNIRFYMSAFIFPHVSNSFKKSFVAKKYVPGDTQVSDLGSEVLSEQDVGSSEVTMDEGRGQRVEIVKALGYIIQDMDSSGDIHVSMGFKEFGQVGMKPLHY